MPASISFDAFRFRLRSKPVPTRPPSSSEEDSDESSPVRHRPHLIHIPSPKNARKSRERLVAIPESPKVSSQKAMQSTHIPLTAYHSNPDRLSKRPPKSAVVSVPPTPSPSVRALQPAPKLTLIRRVTSKLNISIPSTHPHGLRSRPSSRTLPEHIRPPTQAPRSPRVRIPVTPTLPNSFVSKEHREAALRERGLLPPRKDLSEQEREADEHLGRVLLPPSVASGGSTEAERLKVYWLAMNRTSESSDSDCGPTAPSHLHGVQCSPHSILVSSPSSPPSSDVHISRRSCDGMDLPSAGRPSICSSGPPLSTCSYLEVLHEDPSEQAPITPPPPLSPADIPIIVSTPAKDERPSSPVIVESPISSSFSSHGGWPESVLESQSQLDYPVLPGKENVRSPAFRRRTIDAGDRRRKAIGPSLSKFGTNSLSNLRRSVAGSLRLSTADLRPSPTLPAHLAVQAPRTAISPTIHSRGSILLETRDIEDAESRRLSELAFLD